MESNNTKKKLGYHVGRMRVRPSDTDKVDIQRPRKVVNKRRRVAKIRAMQYDDKCDDNTNTDGPFAVLEATSLVGPLIIVG